MNDYEKIECAIHYLEENFADQPSLKQIANHIGLSEFHFQRVFKRWAGISPKRFVQYLTAQYSGALLRDSNSILNASLDAGLTSSSRLHDLIVNVYAMTPEEYKKFGKTVVVSYGWHVTPFGICLAAVTQRGLCWLSFHNQQSGLEDLHKEWRSATFTKNQSKTKKTVDQIFNMNGARTAPILLHLKGTNLQIRVWEALLKIPQGEIVSYSQVAQHVGNPKAVRAVASAVGRNSVSYVIPCHRVIRNTGALGGYRWGLRRKQAMLTWDAAHVENLPSVLEN